VVAGVQLFRLVPLFNAVLALVDRLIHKTVFHGTSDEFFLKAFASGAF
jgi:hypothetical protein